MFVKSFWSYDWYEYISCELCCVWQNKNENKYKTAKTAGQTVIVNWVRNQMSSETNENDSNSDIYGTHDVDIKLVCSVWK